MKRPAPVGIDRATVDLIGLGFLATWRQLDRIESKLDRLLKLENKEMADLSRLTNEVRENTDVVASASALIAKLADEIRNAGTDQGALDALANELDQNPQALADAVAANTAAEGGGGDTTPVTPDEGGEQI